jgi:hypothetical protein
MRATGDPTMRLLAIPLTAALLAGCGADVATSAATTANLQKQQLEQAKAQEAQLKKGLEGAMQAAPDRNAAEK